MAEGALYEIIGRKQAELEALHGEYDRLLALLATVVEGSVQASTVRVDLQNRRWEVVMPVNVWQDPDLNGDHYAPQAESL